MTEQRVDRPSWIDTPQRPPSELMRAYALQLERDLEVSRAEARAYLARIEADTTYISKLTAEVGRLREAAKEAVRDARGRSGGSVYMIRAVPFKALRAALTPPAHEPVKPARQDGGA